METRHNVWSKGRTFAKVATIALLGVGLFAGGCNKGLKEENAQLIQENTQLRDQNAQLQATNAALQASASSGMSGDAGYAGGGDSGGTTRRARGGGSETIIEIAGDVLFDSGKATLKSTAKKELDRVVSTIKSKHSGRTVKVIGHTDSDPIKKSKWGSNEALSEARAGAVADYLASKGISRSSITTVGKGASEPKGSKAASRRVEIVIVE